MIVNLSRYLCTFNQTGSNHFNSFGEVSLFKTDEYMNGRTQGQTDCNAYIHIAHSEQNSAVKLEFK